MSLMDALTKDVVEPVAPGSAKTARGGAKAPAGKVSAKSASAASDDDDDDDIPCAIFDDQRGRPCGAPVESGTLTCSKHRVRSTRTQISRVDAARRRGGG